jgi:integrase
VAGRPASGRRLGDQPGNATGSGCGPSASSPGGSSSGTGPARNPVIAGDIPKKPDPVPKFPSDRDAKVMTAARASADPRDRIVVELLARTGMRADELADLDADAVVESASTLSPPRAKAI